MSSFLGGAQGNGTLAEVEQNDLETLSHTTGDDASSNAESLHSTYLGRNVWGMNE